MNHGTNKCGAVNILMYVNKLADQPRTTTHCMHVYMVKDCVDDGDDDDGMVRRLE